MCEARQWLRFLILAVIGITLAVIGIVTCGCSLKQKLESRSRLHDIERMWGAMPMYSDATEVNTSSSYGIGKAYMGKHYQSDASYEALKEFYLPRLVEQGWLLKRERPLPTWTGQTNERLLEFRKDDYDLTLQYAGKNAGYGWDYAIDIAWPPFDAGPSAP